MGDYITDSVSGYITIVYQAGLSPTDPDYARLQLIQKMMVALEYAKKDGQTLKMYKL